MHYKEIESSLDRFKREEQMNMNAHAKTVTSYELEELIYNFRKTHSNLNLMNEAMEEKKAKKATLDQEIAALNKILDEMQSNNVNNMLESDIKKIQEKITSLNTQKKICDTACSVAGSIINSEYPWYCAAIAILSKPKYAKQAKEEGIILEEYGIQNVVKYDPKYDKLLKKAQTAEAEASGENKKRTPVPSHLMSIIDVNNQKETRDNPSMENGKQISP